MEATIYQKLMLVMIRAKRSMFGLCDQREISLAQGMLLISVDEHKPLPMSGLSKYIGCDPSNITGLVDKLEGHELIERVVDEKDRRIKMIRLTGKGRKYRQDLMNGLAGAVELDTASLSSQESATLIRLIDKIT